MSWGPNSFERWQRRCFLLISLWTHAFKYIWYVLSFLVLKLFHLWPVGTFSVWLWSLLDMLLGVFDSSLVFWHDKVVQALVNFLLQNSATFPWICGFFYWQMVFRNHNLSQEMFIAPCHLVPSPSPPLAFFISVTRK